MSARRPPTLPPGEALFATSRQKPVPLEFILAELEDVAPVTKPMFGCTAIYVNETMMFILRDRHSDKESNGVWVASSKEHHASLRAELASLRPLDFFGFDRTGWQYLPVDASGFEDDVLRVCALVRTGDVRIGKQAGRGQPGSAKPSAATKPRVTKPSAATRPRVAKSSASTKPRVAKSSASTKPRVAKGGLR